MTDDCMNGTSGHGESAGEIAAAPWQLTGSGYIVLLRLPPGVVRQQSFTPQALRAGLLPGISILMFVDYWASAVGPYRELLFIPGRFRIGQKKRWSITRILVSTAESVIGGRRNWGIPKEQADFRVSREPDGNDWIEVSQQGQRLAEMVFDSTGPGLPLSGGMIPEKFRAMSQYLDDRHYCFSPRAEGKLQYARLRAIRTDHKRFPELRTSNVLVALKVPRFEMTFPVAQVSPIHQPAPRATP